MRVKRMLVAALTAVALLTATGTAEAAESSPEKYPTSYTIKPKVEFHWWGFSLKWNKETSKLIAAGAIPGASAGAGILVAGVPGAIVGGSAGFGLAQEAANQAIEHGNCLQFVQPWSAASGWFWRWHC